tara:strand:+ start:58 stop:651 length:594 start_codon:yes stop_codon:yes gene_type:complete
MESLFKYFAAIFIIAAFVLFLLVRKIKSAYKFLKLVKSLENGELKYSFLAVKYADLVNYDSNIKYSKADKKKIISIFIIPPRAGWSEQDELSTLGVFLDGFGDYKLHHNKTENWLVIKEVIYLSQGRAIYHGDNKQPTSHYEQLISISDKELETDSLFKSYLNNNVPNKTALIFYKFYTILFFTGSTEPVAVKKPVE